MDRSAIISITLEVGVILASTIASFILPGLAGMLVGGALQLLGDIGIQLYGGQLPSSPMWFLTEFMAVFGPYFMELKSAKMESSLLRTLNAGAKKTADLLQKVDDALLSSIEFLKNKVSNKFTSKSGLTPQLENEVRQVEQQELAREKFGNKAKVTKKLNSFTPNTKNPESWIAGVGFRETARLGKRDIRGDLIITYYVGNQYRVGFVKKLKKGAKIVLGRTSSGVRTGDNQSKYFQHIIPKDPSKVKIRKIVFKGARYYNDYLSFLKSHSWGGYYMRKWMVGVPGRKASINALVLFGDYYRVGMKLKGLTGDLKTLFTDPNTILKAKGSELFGQTRLGSKWNKAEGYFSQASQIKASPFTFGTDVVKSKMEGFRDETITKNVTKKRRRP